MAVGGEADVAVGAALGGAAELAEFEGGVVVPPGADPPAAAVGDKEAGLVSGPLLSDLFTVCKVKLTLIK